ncbi:DNA ligase D [Roseitranquillus sediminis]|uniref:DNA ligase D n=1 Tax=Roseitranquillus sediminis TaxID=2809051 RepID=UPI001D0C9D96|nr:DNA ligase D [Roseitranquillus sediminis]MBM9595583.1 DNA ligase D [Roseitranquillus sediminis]
MALKDYEAKRDFDATPEPRGGTSTASGRSFCVQKHDATRLHYDLRLEHEGVLLSWAVTKGPSTDPSQKRLAVRTEDHPIDYGGFEGVIPEGYGAGTVMLWDRGEWEPLHDVDDGLRQGKLHFRIHGARMRGGWALVRMRGARKGDAKRENWLLVKEADDLATDEPDGLIGEHTTSIATGRDLEEIAADAPARAPERGARPKFRDPMLATASDDIPEGDAWWFEPKLDGYRCQIAVGKGGVRCYSRNGLDWTDRFHDVAQAAEGLTCRRALIDAEIVARDDESFSGLQTALKEGRSLVAYAFDLLHLDGTELSSRPLTERRERLETLLEPLPPRGPLRLSPMIEGHGPALFEAVCAAGGEGVIAKRIDGKWRSGRGTAWRKIKCTRRAEFIVAGWMPSDKKGRPFASLVLATREGGELTYRGRVGGGFGAPAFEELAPLLERHARKGSPFGRAPADARGARWVEPKLVVEVRYAELTSEGIIRHGVYEGLREDKAADEVSAHDVGVAPPEEPKQREVLGIRISSADRQVFPNAGLTKGGLADYYAATAERLLAHGQDRPLSLIRCPDGVSRSCFFQKHGGKGFPAAMTTFRSEGEDWLYLGGAQALISAVQMGSVEFHIRGVRRDRLDRPDRVVFDLDPDEGLTFDAVREAAAELRALLSDIGLKPGLMTTGGKGLHVVLALRRTTDVETISAFARTVATHMAGRWPDRFTAKMTKSTRKGRIFVDWQRNTRGATAICPWSVRARPGAPVAMPLDWDELPDLPGGNAFNVAAALERLDRPDPLAAIATGTLSNAVLRRLEDAIAA